MSLLAAGNAAPAVSERCLRFIRQSVRVDGSWPIDTNLSVWMTTNAVTALAHAGALAEIDTGATGQWLRERQYRDRHPLTNAPPGGWGWTHLPGGVPDADDTCGALLALATLGELEALPSGSAWLLQMQNADGGWPTFCRGWGQLPFDTSTPDVTAHALRTLRMLAAAQPRVDYRRAVERGFRYLTARQRADGAWTPLWFGNQAAALQENPVLGTARVLLAYAGVGAGRPRGTGRHPLSAGRATAGWRLGGDRAVPASMEESALAISALTRWPLVPGVDAAVHRGVGYLLARLEEGSWEEAAPIGLYFARLWYAEQLYPILWTVDALGRVAEMRATCAETGTTLKESAATAENNTYAEQHRDITWGTPGRHPARTRRAIRARGDSPACRRSVALAPAHDAAAPRAVGSLGRARFAVAATAG